MDAKQKKASNQEIPTLNIKTSTNNLKKTPTKKKTIDIPLLNNDHEQELYEAKVVIEKGYNMSERLLKKIVIECDDDSEEEEEEP